MPELPEVETLRRQLEASVTGATVTGVAFVPGTPSAVAAGTEDGFAAALSGRTIEGVGRRGKYLDIHLSGGLHWVLHLRMTGRVLVRPAGAEADPYTRFTAFLTGPGDRARELRFADVRKFGRTWVAPALADVLPRLGPEPWDETFSADYLRSRLAHRKGPLKAAVLDQALVAGVGNIYADEALFHARIHPLRSGSELAEGEFERLRAAIAWALEHGVDLRGASFRDFVDTEGRDGGMQNETRVFQRVGEPCLVCGTPVEKIKVGGRGTHYCPTCQPRAGHAAGGTAVAGTDGLQGRPGARAVAGQPAGVAGA